MAKIIEANPLPQVCQECKDIIECGGNTAWCCEDCEYIEECFLVVDDTGKVIVE